MLCNNHRVSTDASDQFGVATQFWSEITGGSLITVRVPTQTGKPGKMERHFSVREKSENFEQTRKVRVNQGKSHKILENSGIVIFSNI